MRKNKLRQAACLAAVIIITSFVSDYIQATAVDTEENRTDSVQDEICYLVRNGDSLSYIAKDVYGDADRWWEIYQANQNIIGDNPDYIQAGIYLELPDMADTTLEAETVAERDTDRQLLYRQGDNVYYLADMDEPDDAIAIWSPYGLANRVSRVGMKFSDSGKYIIEYSEDGLYRIDTSELERNPDSCETEKMIGDCAALNSYYYIEESETLIYENEKGEFVYFDGTEHKVISEQLFSFYPVIQGERKVCYLKHEKTQYDLHCYDLDTGKDDCIATGVAAGKAQYKVRYKNDIFIYYKKNEDNDSAAGLDLYMARLGEKEQLIDNNVYTFYDASVGSQAIYYAKDIENAGLYLYCWEEGKGAVQIAETESYRNADIAEGIAVYTKQSGGIFYRTGGSERWLGLPSDRHLPRIEVSPDGTKAMLHTADQDSSWFLDSFRIEGSRMIYEAEISGRSGDVAYGCWNGNVYYYAKRLDRDFAKKGLEPDRGPTDLYFYQDGIRRTIFSGLSIDFGEDCKVYEDGGAVVLIENKNDYYAGNDLMLYGIGIENNLIDTDVYRYSYINKNRIVYAKGGNLYVYANGRTHLIAEDVDGFSVHDAAVMSPF